MSVIYNLNDTWNDALVDFSAIKMNVADTASGAASKLLDLQVNTVSKFSVAKSGATRFSAGVTFAPAASATPAVNGDVTFELTNNTTLTIKAKGSDGIVRSVALTLAP